MIEKTKVLKAYRFEKNYQRITYDGNATVWFKDIPSGNIHCDKPLELSEGTHGDSTLFAPIGSMLLHMQGGWKCVCKVQKGDILTRPYEESQKKILNPDRRLQKLRELCRDVLKMGPGEWERTMIKKFEELDKHLSEGGPLPEKWNKRR